MRLDYRFLLYNCRTSYYFRALTVKIWNIFRDRRNIADFLTRLCLVPSHKCPNHISIKVKKIIWNYGLLQLNASIIVRCQNSHSKRLVTLSKTLEYRNGRKPLFWSKPLSTIPYTLIFLDTLIKPIITLKGSVWE